jgi:putative sterol carrier protein
MLFDGLRRQLDTSIAPGATIQWNFTDAEPWHLRIDNGATAALPGRVEAPDLTFRCSFDTWLDLAAGRIDPWRAVATGRMRPTGKLRLLVRAPKLFA